MRLCPEYEVTLCALCCVGSGNFLIQNTLEIFNFNIWRLSNLHCNRKISNMTLQFYLDFLFWRFSTHESRLIKLKANVIIIKVSKVSSLCYFGFNLNNCWSLEQSRKEHSQQHNNESNAGKYLRRDRQEAITQCILSWVWLLFVRYKSIAIYHN